MNDTILTQDELQRLFQRYSSIIPKMIVSRYEDDKKSKNMPVITIKDIRNFDGYDVKSASTGKPLVMHYKGKQYPIGYKICFPAKSKHINHVVVDIYGGNTKEDHEKLIKTVQNPPQLCALLEEQDFATVSLVLPDFLHSTPQDKMDPELFDLIQSCIHEFYLTIKEAPEQLSEVLKNKGLEKASYTLFGESFGGLMAVRHGQMYPGTFDGVVSHDGYLISNSEDFETPFAKDWSLKHPEVLSPSEHIRETQTPLLIFHNRTDNNVNIRHALDFYDQLSKLGRSNLAQVCFSDLGSLADDETDIANTGHYLPQDQVRYFEVLFNFIKERPGSHLPEYHHFTFLRQKNIPSIYHGSPDIRSKFLAMAHDKFKRNPEHIKLFKDPNHSKAWDDVWEKEYQPLIAILSEVDYMVKNRDYAIDYYLDILFEDKITDDVIENALRPQAQAMSELIYGLQGVRIPADQIIKNPEIKSYFKEQLLTLSENLHDDYKRRYYLECLFLNNPDLMPPLEARKSLNVEQLNIRSKRFKKVFSQEQRDYGASIRATWQAAAREARILKKVENQEEPISTSSKSTKPRR